MTEQQKTVDYGYIAEQIAGISRIPVRVYCGGEKICGHDPIGFPKDLCELHRTTLAAVDSDVFYYITEAHLYYGVVRHNGYTMVLGPTFQIMPDSSQLADLFFMQSIEKKDQAVYTQLIRQLTPMPMELFIHLLCLVYYFVTGEKLSLTEVLTFDSFGGAQLPPPPPVMYEPPEELAHDTMSFEQEMLQLITAGDAAGLNELLSTRSPGQSGKLAENGLRQSKNTLIVSATLVSRAAIKGGMPTEEALSLSDSYIRQVERQQSIKPVMALQYKMVLDYAQRVNKLNRGVRTGKLVHRAIVYVQEHLTEDLSVEKVAAALYVGRSMLSTRFKEEMGVGLSAYILQQRMEKAKEYLLKTDHSVLEISTFLNFSSQSHFQNVFKKYTGQTPREFRSRNHE